MAETLFLPDGSSRVIFNSDDRERVLSALIREYLGRDCEDMFSRLLAETRETAVQKCEGDDYEQIADGYLAMLHSTLDELDAVLALFSASRMDRRKLHGAVRRCRDNLYNNL